MDCYKYEHESSGPYTCMMVKLLLHNRLIYRVRHKSVNTPLSHERLVGGLQDDGRGTHVTHFVQLYPQPLYTCTASQVRTTCLSWDEGVLTDVCLTGVLTELCLTLYFQE